MGDRAALLVRLAVWRKFSPPTTAFTAANRLEVPEPCDAKPATGRLKPAFVMLPAALLALGAGSGVTASAVLTSDGAATDPLAAAAAAATVAFSLSPSPLGEPVPVMRDEVRDSCAGLICSRAMSLGRPEGDLPSCGQAAAGTAGSSRADAAPSAAELADAVSAAVKAGSVGKAKSG